MSTIKKNVRTLAVKNVDTTPVASAAPRVEGSADNVKYTFRSFKDFAICLKDGTAKLTTEVDDSKMENPDKEKRKLTIITRVKYSDGALGAITVVLKGSSLIRKVPFGSSTASLNYPFLQTTDRDYEKRKYTEDTQEDYADCMSFLLPQLAQARAEYYPAFSESYHIGKDIKLKEPKSEKAERLTNGSAEFEAITINDFKMSDHMASKGRLQIRLGAGWMFSSRGGLDNLLLGYSWHLVKSKYLTDEEKIHAKAEKDAQKMELEKAAENKIKRDEKIQLKKRKIAQTELVSDAEDLDIDFDTTATPEEEAQEE